MVCGASEGSCESVAASGEGAFVAAAPLCAHQRTSMLYRYQTLVSEITLLFLLLELINHQIPHAKMSGQNHGNPRQTEHGFGLSASRGQRDGEEWCENGAEPGNYDDAMLIR